MLLSTLKTESTFNATLEIAGQCEQVSCCEDGGARDLNRTTVFSRVTRTLEANMCRDCVQNGGYVDDGTRGEEEGGDSQSVAERRKGDETKNCIRGNKGWMSLMGIDYMPRRH